MFAGVFLMDLSASTGVEDCTGFLRYSCRSFRQLPFPGRTTHSKRRLMYRACEYGVPGMRGYERLCGRDIVLEASDSHFWEVFSRGMVFETVFVMVARPSF